MTPPNDDISEQCSVVGITELAGGWFNTRLHSPKLANTVQPGHRVYIHVNNVNTAPDTQASTSLPIMGRDPQSGHIDLLYPNNECYREIAKLQPGDSALLTGPLASAFTLNTDRAQPLLIADTAGIAAMIFLATEIHKLKRPYRPIMFLGTNTTFPFRPVPSRIVIATVPAGAIGAMPLMEDWFIPSRLASEQGLPGCFEGSVTELAHHWLTQLAITEKQDIEIFASGSPATMASAIALADEFQLPYQVTTIDQS